MSVILTSVGITFPDTTSQTTAAAGEFTSGTVMLFQQTAAPTGWTKSTTHNNKALRVVSGSASSGGTVAFSTAFASQSVAGSVSITGVVGSAGATTLTTAQLASHSHSIDTYFNNTCNPANKGVYRADNRTSLATVAGTAAGSNSSHSHSFSFTSGTGSFSGTAIDMSVQYVDIILATKD